MSTRKLWFAFGGYRFSSDGKFLKYQSAYGKSFRVLISDIETVSLEKAGAGKNAVKIIGRGTTLAEVLLPQQWSEKAQEFILDEISSRSTQDQEEVILESRSSTSKTQWYMWIVFLLFWPISLSYWVVKKSNWPLYGRAAAVVSIWIVVAALYSNNEFVPSSPVAEQNQPAIEQPSETVVEKQYTVYEEKAIENQKNIVIIVREKMSLEDIDSIIPDVISSECGSYDDCVVSVHDSELSARLSRERQSISSPSELTEWEEKNMPVIEEHWLTFYTIKDGKVTENYGYQPQKSK